ncbi:hypothetical protein [Hellea balneolensis]|uniref:hypothetical protein n=1 Tax=Hellea balneolensis TaxID=287478 RepID=UPI00047A2ECC|nr:hypothetical protein [Hellea balneolensis]
MGSDKIYRWEKRRAKRYAADKSFHLDILDWVTLILISVMFFISLRLFFIFEVTTAPCVEMILTMGQSSWWPSIFTLTYWICLFMSLFWFCVSVHRAFHRPASWALITWHAVLFISLFFLAATNRNLTASSYINPPDGVMVVESMVPEITQMGINWSTPTELNWTEYKKGQWYASGSKACIWLDESKVSFNDRFDLERPSNMAFQFVANSHAFEKLKSRQMYRPLSNFERETFSKMKQCQADMTKYGQHRSVCTSDNVYPVAPGIEPPPEFLELWGLDK